MSNSFCLDNLVFEVRRSSRRKTLGLTVDRHGELVVHAPTDTLPETLESWVNGRLLWVHRKLAKKRETLKEAPETEFVTGESFSYLGRNYPLKVAMGLESPLHFDGTRFLLCQGTKDPEAHFRRWYIAQGKPWIQERISALTAKAGASPAKIDVRDLGYRWGSCSRKGTLNFHWKVLRLPVRLIDYILLHELIHLREHHHGPRFWSLVDAAMPDWRVRQGELLRLVHIQ